MPILSLKTCDPLETRAERNFFQVPFPYGTRSPFSALLQKGDNNCMSSSRRGKLLYGKRICPVVPRSVINIGQHDQFNICALVPDNKHNKLKVAVLQEIC